MHNIKLKNNKEFIGDPTISVLDSAIKQGIHLDYSCLSARCSSCKMRVLKGTYEQIVDESILTDKEKELGYVLSCNIRPKSDLELNIEDIGVELPKKIIVPSKINSIVKINSSVVKLELRMPPKIKFDFLPGQYLNIIKGSDKRSYSIESSHSKDNKLTFLIKEYEGGLFSEYWFNRAKKDDLLRLEGPLGSFFYRNKKCTDLVFLATGTGIAPIKSILDQLESISIEQDLESFNIWLLWGGRYAEDLFWKPEYKSINLNYTAVLSREKNNDLNSKEGYVQNIVKDFDIQWDTAEVYACGSSVMINDSRKLLIEKGLKESSFYSDAFISTN